MAKNEDLLKWARGAVGRNGSSEDFLAWAKKQAAKKGSDSTISSFDKLKSPYFLRNFATWKDVVDSAQALIKEEARAEAESKLPKVPSTAEKTVASTMEQRQAEYRLTEAVRDSSYYKSVAEDTSKSQEERNKARSEYNRLQGEIKQLESAARTTATKAGQLEKEKAKTSAADKEKQLKSDYEKLKAQYDALIDPTDPEGKGPAIQKKIDALAKEYQKVYSDLVGAQVSYGAARSKLLGTELPTMNQASTTGASQFVPAEAIAAAKATKPSGQTPSSAAKTPSTPSTPSKPSTPSTPPVKSSGPQRTGSEMGGPGGTVVTPASYEDAIAKAMELYQMPDVIFQNVPSLKTLLQKYVDKQLTLQQFVAELGNNIWVRQNSKEIKARYVQKYNYEDLLKSGQATGNTDYEQQIAKISRNVMSSARAMGAAVDETQAKLIAEDLYIHNMESDTAALTKRLAGFIRTQALGTTPGATGYSGQALQDLQTLQGIAKANGLTLKNVVPNRLGTTATEDAITNDVLAGLQDGTIDVNRLSQNARMIAAQGQPQYVRDLLNQGYNLDAIYAPYRKLMADTLELDQNAIDLNDPTLRMAISDKGDMNTYDFNKALKKDNRWQYTQNAAKEVSDKTLRVLQDFGFMG